VKRAAALRASSWGPIRDGEPAIDTTYVGTTLEFPSPRTRPAVLLQ
jgi:hypothetical protein